LALILFLAAEQASAQDAVQLCWEKGTDNGVRPISQSRMPAAKRIFGLRMPDQQVLRSTVFRCAEGTPKSSRKSRTLIPAILLPDTGSARIDAQPFQHDGARPWHS
jgi:hypothetical protein